VVQLAQDDVPPRWSAWINVVARARHHLQECTLTYKDEDLDSDDEDTSEDNNNSDKIVQEETCGHDRGDLYQLL